VMEAAKRHGKALEINAYFERLDLDDVRSRRAKEMGIPLAIGTDTHHLDQLWMMSLGIAVARRGWLEPPDLLNTMDLDDLMNWCHRNR